ncbi:MAG TPA: hypothetical protein VNH83_08180 [Bryobacteraceae bacterium]|nr:hypothetical protein [Bryobacteraceae bacterium]
MANFTATQEAAILNALFTATFSGAWNTVAQNAAAPATNLYISLHNATPGDAGSQTTNETAYTNYARVAVARTTGGWTVAGATPTSVQNAATISFPQCGASGDTLTHFGIGLSPSGAGTLLAYGTIGAGPAFAFTCTSASPGSLTVPGSSMSVNQRASVYPVGPFATLPTGMAEGTVYFVGTVSGIAVTLSTTTANANPVNTSSVGSGVIILQTPLIVSNLITPSFAANALNVFLN